jgi:hypothetical protein
MSSDSYYPEGDQNRAFSLGSLTSKLTGNRTQGPLSGLTSNPVISTAARLHREHPGEMVFLEVAAAGALLYKHRKGKERRRQFEQEAEEDLRRRGWDGGAKMAHDDMVRRTNSGLMVPNQGQRPRPLSAPAVPNPVSENGLAHGQWNENTRPPQEAPLAYGEYFPGQPPPPYMPPPGQYQQPYQPPPSAPPPGQYQYPPQQYPPQGGWHSFGPPSGPPPGPAIYSPQQGYPPQQSYPSYQGPPRW